MQLQQVLENEEKRCISYPYIENSVVHYCDTISEAIKYQGYMIIINNIENINLVSFDKKYRKSLNKYERILIYNEKYNWTYDKWSRFEKVNRGIFDDYSYQLGEEWDKYKVDKENEISKKYNITKQNQLDSLYNYLKEYKTIKTSKIASDLNLNERTIQRYMEDINNIYHNVGYDYSNNEWYFIWQLKMNRKYINTGN